MELGCKKKQAPPGAKDSWVYAAGGDSVDRIPAGWRSWLLSDAANAAKGSRKETWQYRLPGIRSDPCSIPNAQFSSEGKDGRTRTSGLSSSSDENYNLELSIQIHPSLIVPSYF